jgi:hypothetical protein
LKHGIESNLLSNEFKEAIFNTLHIDVKANVCVPEQKTVNIWIEAFINFKKFYEFQTKIGSLFQGQLQIGELLDAFERIVNNYVLAWYWPTTEGTSLFSLLRDQSLNDKKATGDLLRILNGRQPNLNSKMFTMKRRVFLEEALLDIPPLNEKGRYVRTIMTLAEAQHVDMNYLLDTGETYF